MNIEEIREYCLSKKGVTESFPFDETTLVFKVLGKMYALLSLERNGMISLKCDPEYAVELREKHPYIQGAYHMNKVHWNQVDTTQVSDKDFLISLIDHSYDLIVSKMTKKLKAELAAL